jgi:hypothetical protein
MSQPPSLATVCLRLSKCNIVVETAHKVDLHLSSILLQNISLLHLGFKAPLNKNQHRVLGQPYLDKTAQWNIAYSFFKNCTMIIHLHMGNLLAVLSSYSNASLQSFSMWSFWLRVLNLHNFRLISKQCLDNEYLMKALETFCLARWSVLTIVDTRTNCFSWRITFDS